MTLTGTQYTVVAYAIGLALMWGYTALLWVSDWRGARMERKEKQD
jgi:hypothetical protein